MKRIIQFLIIGALMVFLTLLTHELGHVLMAKYFGREILEIKLLGFSIFPEFNFIGFENYFGSIRHSQGLSYTEDGWIFLMGSGFNWIISLGGLFILYLFKKFRVINFYLNSVFIFASLMFLDFTTYMFGLRLSGFKEPLVAADYLGWNEQIFFGIIMLLSIIHLIAAIYLIAASRFWRNFFMAKQNISQETSDFN